MILRSPHSLVFFSLVELLVAGGDVGQGGLLAAGQIGRLLSQRGGQGRPGRHPRQGPAPVLTYRHSQARDVIDPTADPFGPKRRRRHEHRNPESWGVPERQVVHGDGGQVPLRRSVGKTLQVKQNWSVFGDDDDADPGVTVDSAPRSPLRQCRIAGLQVRQVRTLQAEASRPAGGEERLVLVVHANPKSCVMRSRRSTASATWG
jgi:hypothetical protein